MKRLLAAAVALCIVGAVMAQSSFTIVRPADGSRVRENVRVLIPKNSIEDGSYVGVFIGGQFVEAVVPPIDPTNKNYRVYTLNTKARKIPDGELQLELVKYSSGDVPHIEDRSSVTVTVGNQMNVPVPAGGVYLRYGFVPGSQLTYKVMESVTVSTLSGLGNSVGGRAAQFPQSEAVYRIMYAIDNVYGNGNALVRMQPLPNKGKDYALLTVANSTEPQQVFDYQMEPVYMKVDKTGRAQPNGGAVPEYFGFSDGGATEGGEFAFGVWPLPVLPTKKVAPGAAWEVPYQISNLHESASHGDINKVTQSFPARGEFVSAEWEMGHPCAKIHNSIAEGTRSFKGQELAKAGRAFDDDRVSLDETIYFALDTKRIIKLVRSVTIDRKGEIATGGANNSGAPGKGPGGKGGPSISGMAPGGPGPSSPPGDDRKIIDRQKRGGGMAPGGAPGMMAPQGGPAQGRSGGGAAGGTRTQYIRLEYKQIFLLEQ